MDREGSEKGIGVLVVGGASQLYRGLKELASQAGDIRWIEAVHTCEEALERARGWSPDVLLLELQLPGTREYELVCQLRQEPAFPPLIALSPSPDDDYLYLAISLGAAACLPIDTPPEFLISTIWRVYQGEQPIQYSVLSSVSVASQMLRRLRELPPLPVGRVGPSPLSRRERGILRVVAQGYSNKEIASQLGIQEQTVKNHVSSILRKMGAKDRAHAAVLALQSGWISLS